MDLLFGRRVLESKSQQGQLKFRRKIVCCLYENLKMCCVEFHQSLGSSRRYSKVNHFRASLPAHISGC